MFMTLKNTKQLILPLSLSIYTFWMLIHNSANSFLDNVNLLFHEAGHVIFGIVGNEFVMFIGGTIMQLIAPIIVVLHFRKEKSDAGEIFGWWWLGQNLVNVAVYVADANRQVLELLGYGQHDWNYLLSTLDILPLAEELGLVLRLLGYGIMFGIIGKSVLANLQK